MIRDTAAHAALRVVDERKALAALSADETLAIGEALWTSSLASDLWASEEPRPTSLAVALRIPHTRLMAAQEARRPW